MKDDQGLSTAWGTHSDLPHRGRQGCNFSRQKSPRDILPQELSNLGGPDFFGIGHSLIVLDSVFQDVSSDFLRFQQRTDPLVVIELLRGRVFLFLQKTSIVR